ncbi:acyl-CoA dehydrogenase [Pseudomonas sp. ZM23]|uniref:Acyl-CoA dehydrogenase n=1 Tax=Pseudomonas triclosanedens TaxID=2961893 RepID=A0ABY6ZUQ6_9PSED|nr:acyl-CoA dehydrogenase [Pseudomonas triclosanedens]MCP8467729.1 acyl-CoA dehydrogenase [Pseudomonas triclosanedens]MCP8473646.1 acyl-CoA dehydrogenase [Pseudomonas triclosanedens]MCP8479565.1 acyl-CoA dehydrogenase [Pseudomonas triclosanedens]WAI48687.1 acyl-CoA dehydrogenase [Pseudomonas triclosanedens]
MPWKCLLGPQDRLPAEAALDDWYAELLERAGHASSFELAVLGGRLAATPGRAFLAGYQAALRALWPAAPLSLGAFCVTEKKSVRPADLQTRLEGLALHGRKDFATAAESAAWWLVAARDEEPGEPPRLAMTVVLAGTPGATLEKLSPLPLLPDIPHARLVLDGAHCERLPGDGWETYSKPFRTLEDAHVLASICAWLYGLAIELHWSGELALRLIGVLAGCAEVSRHPASQAEAHLLLAGVFAQFESLSAALEAAFAGADPLLAAAWQRDRGVLAIAGAARAKRLEKAKAVLGLDPSQ